MQNAFDIVSDNLLKDGLEYVDAEWRKGLGLPPPEFSIGIGPATPLAVAARRYEATSLAAVLATLNAIDSIQERRAVKP